MKKRGITILLPTLDEAKALQNVVNRIPVDEISSNGLNIRMVVVDGGSTDGTIELASQLNCEIIEQHGGSGKGRGLREAFANFMKSDDSLLVMMDADGTYSPEEIPQFIQKLEEENADIVIGSRMKGKIQNGAMTRRNWLGNHILTWLAVFLHRAYISDLCTGFWLLTRDSIDKMKLNSTGFEIEAEMYTSAAYNQLKIHEIPIHYDIRIGRSKLGSVGDGIRIAMKIIKRRFVRKPIS
ncbi:MAG: glycosyltransferase family 2 protein [Candidatus Thermoplasmatota archaeon]|nr:glycosyltransferase family 2 protein [Candidatus Thermoplasmatota archaeon]